MPETDVRASDSDREHAVEELRRPSVDDPGRRHAPRPVRRAFATLQP